MKIVIQITEALDADRQDRIEKKIDRLLDSMEGVRMVTKESLAALISRLDTFGNAHAAKLQAMRDEIAALKAQVAAGTMTPEQKALLESLESFETTLGEEVSQLEQLGRDPDAPIPTDPNPPVDGTVG